MITGIILASGFSKRMQKEKLLIDIDGETLIHRVIKSAVESNLNRVILIYRIERVREIAQKFSIESFKNKKANKGLSQSIKMGVKNSDEDSSYMFIVGDQPYLDYKIINKIITSHKENNAQISVPYYNGIRGMPTIISNKYRDELLKICGDKGGREIINKNFSTVNIVNINSEISGLDIDSLKDIEKLNYVKNKLNID